MLELNKIEVEEKKVETETPEFLQEILQSYESIFHMPKGLPPPRDKEHRIALRNGSNPISVRLYRYPQIQKEEIEKLVEDMLAARTIQPSISPYSSPVLLVKKKDGS